MKWVFVVLMLAGCGSEFDGYVTDITAEDGVRRIEVPEWCVEECRAMHGGDPIPDEAKCKGVDDVGECACVCVTEED